MASAPNQKGIERNAGRRSGNMGVPGSGNTTTTRGKQQGSREARSAKDCAEAGSELIGNGRAPQHNYK